MADELSNFSGIDFRNARGIQWLGGDKAGVIFYNRPIHHAAKSAEAGTQIFEDRVYVKVQHPGERDCVDRPANRADAQRWPMQWHQFQQNQQQIPEGTPISLLYPDKPSVTALMQANGVHTIQQLAGLSGNAIENIGMGAQSYVNAAQKYLEIAEKGVSGSQLQHELAERDSQIRVQAQQIDTLKEEVQRLRATATGGVSLEQVQALVNAAAGRPVHTTTHNVQSGGPAPNPNFDPATVMINSTHPTQEIAQQRAGPAARARAARAAKAG